MSTKIESGSSGLVQSGSQSSKESEPEAAAAIPPLQALDDLLLDESEWFEDESRVSIILQQAPPTGGAGPRSLAPVRVVRSVLSLLPPWGRVIVLSLAILGALVAYRWEQVAGLLGL